MKRMTAMLLTLGLLSAALTGCQGGVTTPKTEALAEVTVGSDTYPPFVYMDENGDPTGIDVEIAHEAFRRMGYQAEFTIINWEEKKTLLAFVPFSVLLFVGGCVFAFEIVLPRGLAFFLEFTSPAVQPLLSLESYLDFMVMLVLPFGVLFNLPLALLFLALAGLIRSEQMRKARRFVIFGSFVAAGILTPTTDIVTQCLLAVPLILLYELSYGMIRFGLGR